jgi:hypothetical protein
MPRMRIQRPLSCRAQKTLTRTLTHTFCAEYNAGVCARACVSESEPIGRTKHKLNLPLRQLTSSLPQRAREKRGLITINRRARERENSPPLWQSAQKRLEFNLCRRRRPTLPLSTNWTKPSKTRKQQSGIESNRKLFH